MSILTVFLEAIGSTIAEISAYAPFANKILEFGKDVFSYQQWVSKLVKTYGGGVFPFTGGLWRALRFFREQPEILQSFDAGSLIDPFVARVIEKPIGQFDSSTPYRYRVNVTAYNSIEDAYREYSVWVHTETPESTYVVIQAALLELRSRLDKYPIKWEDDPGSPGMAPSGVIVDFARFTQGL
jgi:hypothetical protein